MRLPGSGVLTWLRWGSAKITEELTALRLNTTDRKLLQLIADETKRAGEFRVPVRRIAEHLNLGSAGTVTRRLNYLVTEGLVKRTRAGSINSSASYALTHKGKYRLAILNRSEDLNPLQMQASRTLHSGDITDTWYRSAPVPDAMRSRSLRGPWELWSTQPHELPLTVAETLPRVSARASRTVSRWVDLLTELVIPLAQWTGEQQEFRLLEADPHVFDQLRQVQKNEAAQQGRRLRGRADLERSHEVEQARLDRALRVWSRRP